MAVWKVSFKTPAWDYEDSILFHMFPLAKKKKKNNSAEYHSPETASVYFLNRELFRSQASVGLRFQSPNWVFALEPERGKQSVSAGGGSDWFCLCPFGLHLFFCREISRRGSMSKCICALPMLLN